VLLSLLTFKFGPISQAIRTRVTSASIADLETLTARALAARNVQEVLEPARAKPARSPKKTLRKKR
jgi:hypothetical protein